MSIVVKQLAHEEDVAVSSLWQAAIDERRRNLGFDAITTQAAVLSRPGSFGVGILDGPRLVSIALAMPARADDAHSDRNVPGLAHISSVATLPGEWGRGLGGLSVRAVMSQAGRRGYARAQLWTHDSNVGARRLYEREGFAVSGRRRHDDRGEPILHFLRELPAPALVARRAARLLCVDPEQQVLLMHWQDPVDGYRLWEPPGGGLEPGETQLQAVRREWAEETGLPLPDLGSSAALVARDVVWRGGRVVTDEDFFFGTTSVVAARLQPGGFTPAERVDSLGHDWVHWRKLDSLDDPVEPDLIPVLRRLAPDGPWAGRPVTVVEQRATASVSKPPPCR
ncbi:MAG: GNAT family N-acetyltransferase [Nocardioidaceae bacterium]